MSTTQTTRPPKSARVSADAPAAKPDRTAPHAAARFNAAGAGEAVLGSGEAARLRHLVNRSTGHRIADAGGETAQSDARIHDDAAAAEAARLLDAEAFTLGRDIFLSHGLGAPGRATRAAALRHELAHVAQSLAPPDGPPPPLSPTAVAGPAHALETRPGEGRAPDGLILRLPANLPTTAGGQALGFELETREEDQDFKDIHSWVETQNFDELANKDPRAPRAQDEDVVEVLRKDLGAYRDAISWVSDWAIRQRMLKDFDNDVSAIVFFNFYSPEMQDTEPQTFDDFQREIDRVFEVYDNFVTLYLLEQKDPDVVSPYQAPMKTWFETRAFIFRQAALQRGVASLYEVFASLSADIAAAEREDTKGPELVAELLFGSLFEDGISNKDMDAVADIYATVLYNMDVDKVTVQEPDNDPARLDAVALDLGPDYLKPTVIGIEMALVAAGKMDEAKRFRQGLAKLLAAYLANVEEPGFYEFTEKHLKDLRDFFAPYQQSAIFVVFIDTHWSIQGAGDRDAKDDSPSSDGDGHGPPASDLQDTAPPSEPEPVEEVCDGEEIDADKILAWLKMRNTDNQKYSTRFNDVKGLICANRPYTDSPDARVVRGNLKAMQDEADTVLSRFDRHIQRARWRANAILYARASDLAVFGPPLPDDMQPKPSDREEPDLLKLLGYHTTFDGIFDNALTKSGGGFDPARQGDAISVVASDYFKELAYYQISLKAAVDLRNDLISSGMETHITENGLHGDVELMARVFAMADNAGNDYPDWPDWSASTLTSTATSIDLAVIRMTGIRDVSSTDRDIDNIEALQADIFRTVPEAVRKIRADAIASMKTDSRSLDYIRYDDIWPTPLKDMLSPGWETYSNEVKPAVEAALEMVNEKRLGELGDYIKAATEAGDGIRSEALLARYRDLSGQIQAKIERNARTTNEAAKAKAAKILDRFANENRAEQFASYVQEINLASARHLLQLYMMTQAAVSGPNEQGRVIRQVNLLNILLGESSQKTLNAAMDELGDTLDIIMRARDPGMRDKLLKGEEGQSDSVVGLYDSFITTVGPMLQNFSSLHKAAGPGAAEMFEASSDIQDSAKSGMLKRFLEAERAGGLNERNVFLAKIADDLRDRKTMPALTTARFMYADIIGVAHLIDEIGMPTKVAEAKSREGKRNTTLLPITKDDQGNPVTHEADEAMIKEYEDEKDKAWKTLDAGYYPVREGQPPRALTALEIHCRDAYKKISGRGELFGWGEEDTASSKEFGKQVVKMAVVIFVTRGIGGGGAAAGGAHGVRAATAAARLRAFGGAAARMGAFTALMRIDSTLSTGRYPHTSIWEDFAINLATEGVGLATRGIYRGVFGLGQTSRLSTRHAVGIFASEMATTSVASMIAAGIQARIFDRKFTEAEMRKALFDNAAMMVAMRGVHVLGARATTYIDGRLGDAAVRKDVRDINLASLQTRMKVQDDAIRDAARDMLKKTSDMDRMALLEDQLAAMRRKLALLQESTNPEVRMLAESYKQGIEAHEQSVRQARVHIQINARPAGHNRGRGARAGPTPEDLGQDYSPNMTYDATPAAARALEAHLANSGNAFFTRQGRHGTIFEVTLPNGLKVRYRPRPAARTGSSRGGSFADSPRIEAEEISAADPMQLMSIITSDNLTHPDLDKAIGNELTISTGGVTFNVLFQPVETLSQGIAPHASGPARYRASGSKDGGFKLRDDGSIDIVVEVRTDASNDHIVRAVNAEIRELNRISVKLDEATTKGHANYVGPLSKATFEAVVDQQSQAGALKKTGFVEGAELTADDISTVHGMNFLGKRLSELVDRINDPETPEIERAELYKRQDLVMRDFEALWTEAGMPKTRAGIKSIIGQLEAAGFEAGNKTAAYLEGMRFTKAGHPLLDRPVTMLDLHIAFSELQKAMPDKFEGVTIHDFSTYYHKAIARSARKAYTQTLEDRLKAGDDPQAAAIKAADAQLKKIIDLGGGLATPSARGRIYEGMSIREFNENHALRAQYGRMYGIDRNNYPTYDAVTVRGAPNGFRVQEVDIPVAGGKPIKELHLIDVDGTVFFKARRGKNGALAPLKTPTGQTYPIRYDVQMWSAKARDSLSSYDVLKATAFTQTARRIGRMVLSPEAMQKLVDRVSWYDTEIARMRALGADKKTHKDYRKYRLTVWRRDRLDDAATMGEKLSPSNRRIDAMHEAIKAEYLHSDDVDLLTEDP